MAMEAQLCSCPAQSQSQQDFNYSQHQLHHQTISLNHSPLLANNSNSSNHLSTPISQGFERHTTEVDHSIRSHQNEMRMRIMVLEQRKQQVAALVRKVETEAVRMVRQKDEEIAEAAKRRGELEECVSRAEAENAWWRRVAEEKEQIIQRMETEEESRCGEGEGRRRMVGCTRCRSSSASVMFLPCRHLCSCNLCEPFLDACPLCRVPKKSTIHTLLF